MPKNCNNRAMKEGLLESYLTLSKEKQVAVPVATSR